MLPSSGSFSSGAGSRWTTRGRGSAFSLSLNRPSASGRTTNSYRFSGSFGRDSGGTPGATAGFGGGSTRSDSEGRRPLFGFSSSQGRPGYTWKNRAKNEPKEKGEKNEMLKSKSVDDIKKEDNQPKAIDYSDEFNCEILYVE